MLDDRQAVGLEHGLHRGFVHSDRGGEDTGTHVRNVGELEEALDGAVFAVGTVEHDHDDVEPLAELEREAPGGLGAREALHRSAFDGFGAIGEGLLHGAVGVVRRQRDPGLGGQRPQGLAADDPASVAGDADGDDGVTALLEGGDDRGRGGERHLVLPGAPAKDHAHAQARHTSHSSSRARAARRSRSGRAGGDQDRLGDEADELVGGAYPDASGEPDPDENA